MLTSTVTSIDLDARPRLTSNDEGDVRRRDLNPNPLGRAPGGERPPRTLTSNTRLT